MGYPNAYCVHCREHTETNDKKTVLLQNSSRALTGNCGKCGEKVYQILPRAEKFLGKTKVSSQKNEVKSWKIDNASFTYGALAVMGAVVVTAIFYIAL